MKHPAHRIHRLIFSLLLVASSACGDPGPGNRPPTFVTTPPSGASVYLPYEYTLVCADPDGDLVSLRLDPAADTCGGAVQDAGDRTGRYSFTPTPADADSSCTVGLVCDDGHGEEGQATQATVITVGGPPAADELVYDAFSPWAEPIADYHEAAMLALGNRNFEWGLHELAVWQDRLYFGYGDANINVGRQVPIEVRSFATPEPTAAASEFTTDDEIITRYRIAGDRLVMPGIDATEDDLLGNVYTLDATGWTKHRSLVGGLHIHDVADLGGDLYAAGSGGSWDDYYASEIRGLLWRYSDTLGGFEQVDALPHPAPPGDQRLTNLLVVNGILHAFGYYSSDGTTRGIWYRRGANGLETWDGIDDFFVLGTQPIASGAGLVWGVNIESTLTWGTRLVTATAADPVVALDGATVLDAAPLSGDRILLLLRRGDVYPTPADGPFDITVAVLEANGTVLELLSQTLDTLPLSLAFWQRHLYLGLDDGALWRATGSAAQ